MKVRYTDPALDDLRSILDYIGGNSPQSALSVKQRLQQAIERLESFPNIGVITDDPTVRRLTITPTPYLVFYEVTLDHITIHAIRHSARDPKGMPGGT